MAPTLLPERRPALAPPVKSVMPDVVADTVPLEDLVGRVPDGPMTEPPIPKPPAFEPPTPELPAFEPSVPVPLTLESPAFEAPTPELDPPEGAMKSLLTAAVGKT